MWGGAWTEEEKTDVRIQQQFAINSTPSLPDRTLDSRFNGSQTHMRSDIPEDNALSGKTALPAESAERKPISKSAIDQIRSEIFEEKYILSVEPEYWDESHNWDLDNDNESEEYWHFVGRYE